MIREFTLKADENAFVSAEDAENTKGVPGFLCAAAPPFDDQPQFALRNCCSDKRQMALVGQHRHLER